ncbi:MAG: hypothetical protein Q9227_002920 [Pyrenula ochraceoflavens]
MDWPSSEEPNYGALQECLSRSTHPPSVDPEWISQTQPDDSLLAMDDDFGWSFQPPDTLFPSSTTLSDRQSSADDKTPDSLAFIGLNESVGEFNSNIAEYDFGASTLIDGPLHQSAVEDPPIHDSTALLRETIDLTQSEEEPVNPVRGIGEGQLETQGHQKQVHFQPDQLHRASQGRRRARRESHRRHQREAQLHRQTRYQNKVIQRVKSLERYGHQTPKRRLEYLRNSYPEDKVDYQPVPRQKSFHPAARPRTQRQLGPEPTAADPQGKGHAMGSLGTIQKRRRDDVDVWSRQLVFQLIPEQVEDDVRLMSQDDLETIVAFVDSQVWADGRIHQPNEYRTWMSNALGFTLSNAARRKRKGKSSYLPKQEKVLAARAAIMSHDEVEAGRPTKRRRI